MFAAAPTSLHSAPARRRDRLAGYLPALLVGVVAAVITLEPATVDGTGGVWLHPGRDLAQNLTGHLAAQAGPFGWPPLVAPALWWPRGLSAAMTDSNPLFTLLGMLLAAAGNLQPRNLLGPWFLFCLVLQPVAAAFALRGAWRLLPGTEGRRCPPEAALAAAILASAFPAFLYRWMHVNLLGHFLLLAALGVVCRMIARPGGWTGAAVLQLVAVLVHPYLFVFNAVLLLAPLLARAPRPGGFRPALLGWTGAAVVPILCFLALSGGLGGADQGYGFYSMNLLSPLWPQRSGLFGADLPILDATGGQYEGFNYLGGGIIALGLAALIASLRVSWRHAWPLLVPLLLLTVLAVTPRVYAGHRLIVPFGTWPWDQVFGSVRASGRAFWVVGYAVAVFAVARLATLLPRRALLPVLAVGSVLQVVDAAPLWRAERAYFAAGEMLPLPVPALPAGLTLLRLAPVCIPFGPLSVVPDELRLRAVREGAALREVRASRQPRFFNCEAALSDALEQPLRPWEALVVLPPALNLLRAEALGPGTACRTQPGGVVCARNLVPAGAPAELGPALPRLDVPARLGNAALLPVLATGWRPDAGGRAWSDGPRSSLLLVPRRTGDTGATVPLRIILTLTGIGTRFGDAREVVLRVADEAPRQVSLSDGVPTRVEATARIGTGAPLWIRLDMFRPVDPRRRGMDVPINRVGVILDGIELE